MTSKSAGQRQQVHGGGIDVHGFHADLGKLILDHTARDSPPQTGCLQYVGFVHQCDPLVALVALSGLPRVLPAQLLPAYNGRRPRPGHRHATFCRNSCRRSVPARSSDRHFQAGPASAGEKECRTGVSHDGAEIAEQIESSARNCNSPSLRPPIGRIPVPFGAADRAQQGCVRRFGKAAMVSPGRGVPVASSAAPPINCSFEFDMDRP